MTDAASADLDRAIRAVIARAAHLPPQAWDDAASPEALGIDSMGLVEAVFALEEEFAIAIPLAAQARGKDWVQGQGQAWAGLDVATMGAMVAGVRALIQAQEPA